MLRYEIQLPLAPSLNRIWIYGKGRVYRSREYTKWIAEADKCFLVSGLGRGLQMITGPYRLLVELPAKTRADIDNIGSKGLQDWLQRVKIIGNDRTCRDLRIFAGEAPKGQCRVIIEEI